MKTSQILSALTPALLLFYGTTSCLADVKVVAGPRGGRLLENEPPRAEFFVEKDRTVVITFHDAALKPVAPAGQQVTVIAEVATGKVALEFQKKDDALVSKTPLPEGEGYTVVVQVRARPDAKPQNFRLKLKTTICAGCKHVEYACSCDE